MSYKLIVKTFWKKQISYHKTKRSAVAAGKNAVERHYYALSYRVTKVK